MVKSYLFEEEIEKYQLINKVVGLIDTDNPASLIDEIISRESSGSTMISDRIAMPHVKNQFIKQTKVINVLLETGISEWDTCGNLCKVCIFVFVKPDEDEKVLHELKKYIKKFADEEFCEQLVKAKSLAEINNIIANSKGD